MPDYFDAFRSIIAATLRSPSYQAVAGGRRVAWFGEALADLSILTTSEEVEFVDATATGNSSSYEVRIEIFTSTGLRITIEARQGAGEDATHTTTARPRADLVALGVTTDRSVFEAASWREPITATRVHLVYADGTDRVLPADGPASVDQLPNFADFVESLRRDLLAAR